MAENAGPPTTPAQAPANGRVKKRLPVPGDDEAKWSWEKPRPLETQLPSMPVECFGPMAPWLQAVSEGLQAPVEMTALPVLNAIGLIVGNRIRIRVNMSGEGGWWEPINVYTLVVAAPGEKKSPAMSIALQGIKKVEALRQEDAKATIQESQQKLKVLHSKLKGATRRLENAKEVAKQNEAETEVRDLMAQIAALEDVHEPRLLMDDATPEAIARVMSSQAGQIGIIASEGGLFETLMGRYSKGIPNLDLVLKSWDTKEPVTIDRISRDTIVIDQPWLSLGLAVQENVLKSLGERPEAVGRGLTGRFLIALPPSKVGYRRLASMSEQTAGEFTQRAQILETYLASIKSPVEVALTPEANKVLAETEMAWEIRRRKGGDLAAIPEWSNKLVSHTVRVAALLHLIRVVYQDSQSWKPDEQDMENAVALMEWMVAHVTQAHRVMGFNKSASDADALLTYLRDNDLREFKVRDLHQKLRKQRRFKDIAVVRKALNVLTAEGWAKVTGEYGGKPSEYEANPRLFGDQVGEEEVEPLEP